MILTLAPKLQRMPLICRSLIAQGIVKLTGSCNLEGDYRTELHTCPMRMTDPPLGSPFLEKTPSKIVGKQVLS